MKKLLDLAELHKDVTFRFWYASNGVFCFNVSKEGRYVTKQISRDMIELDENIAIYMIDAAIAELKSSMEDCYYERRTHEVKD